MHRIRQRRSHRALGHGYLAPVFDRTQGTPDQHANLDEFQIWRRPNGKALALFCDGPLNAEFDLPSTLALLLHCGTATITKLSL